MINKFTKCLWSTFIWKTIKHKTFGVKFPFNILLLSKYSTNSLNVFDRKAKRFHRDWSAVQSNGNVYDYIKDEVSLKLFFII